MLRGLEEGTPTAKEAAKALGGVETALAEAGLSEELEKLRELFADELTAVAEEFTETTGKKALLGGFAKENLTALVDDRLMVAGSFLQRYADDVRQAVLDSVLAGKKPDLSAILDDASVRMDHLQTEINTALMGYQRAVHFYKAEKAGITKFLYVGPEDDVTREFCAEIVGGIFTAEEIAAMDNEQGLPVELYGGGYNCRHHWRPVSDDLAEELEAEREDESGEEEE